METENVNYSKTDLERRTYRYLQQIAKTLCLPSNVRKVQLIHLIHAKKFKSEAEVNNLIHQVKSERQQLILSRRNRKSYLQNREISSTSRTCQSPAITHTPKRPVHPVMRYSPDFNYTFKCNSKNYQPSTHIPARSITSSDRVLRSCNIKATRKPCGPVNVNSENSIVKVQNQATSPKEKIYRIVTAGGQVTKINLAAKCKEKRHRPSILGGSSCVALRKQNPKQYIIPHNPEVAFHQEPVPQLKRQRTLSGIYPLIPQEIPYQSFDQIQGVRLRHTDGRLTTINALVRKRTEVKPEPKPRNEISIQEILSTIDVNLDNPTHSNNLQTYPSNEHIIAPDNKIAIPVVTESYKRNDYADGYSVYFHQKIRSEQVRYQGTNREAEDGLPKITDVFRKFNNVTARSITEPLYVQVSEESERIPSYLAHQSWNLANTHMLESLYNFKASLLTNMPLLQIATTANTKCVYSTPVITTALAQESVPLVAPEPFSLAHISAVTSPMLSQSHVTIPEMVEDALEIISQDGDYMERIGMDIRVQCLLCSWAGPKIILEFHIRKEHPRQIHKHHSEWSATFTLGALVRADGLWLSQLLEHDEALCVVSAQYREPNGVVATLCSLSSDPGDKFATITAYNKVTGEPFIWEGTMQPMPSNLPYENNLPGLIIELSKLDLLPNSANLKLLNQELVLKSPTKVVVGQPQLNDINIILFISIS